MLALVALMMLIMEGTINVLCGTDKGVEGNRDGNEESLVAET
jgi:hypothetical protein